VLEQNQIVSDVVLLFPTDRLIESSLEQDAAIIQLNLLTCLKYLECPILSQESSIDLPIVTQELFEPFLLQI
jgi:hypothetical protein